jgi:regulator of sigma E protease
VLAAFLSDTANFIWTIGSFLVALGIIVAVHEYGHYIVGRWTGIKADIFSLGFGPVLARRTDRHGTVWQIAAIPLGGFVKFKGDSDAASARGADISALPASEARQTMTGAPIWARSLTVAAGPVFNFVLAFVIFMGVIFASGMAADRPIVGVAHPLPQGQNLIAGDVIVALNGAPTPDNESFARVADAIEPAREVVFTVDRAGQIIDVTAPHPFAARVAAVHPKNAAIDAGIREGDVIVQAAGQPILAFSQLPALVEAAGGASIDLVVWREGRGEIALSLTPNRRDFPTAEGGFETRWLIGLSSGMIFDHQRRSAGPLEAAQIAARQVWAVLAGTYSGLAHMIRGEISTCNLNGPVGLASTMGDAARSGLESFVSMLAVVSLGVGLLNLLPVPVLDGGHLVFYAYEAISGRKPNPRVLNAAVMLGLFMVLALTIFALGNDLTCA